MKYINLFEYFVASKYQKYDSLNEDFKTKKKQFLQQMDIPNAERIVGAYLDDFRKIKDAKYKVALTADIEGVSVQKGNDRLDIDKYKTFKELELFVDYVAGQIKDFRKKETSGNANLVPPIYENDEVAIYYADTPSDCINIKGDLPYTWCVSRKQNNLYYYYRLNRSSPCFYFVKRKRALAKELEKIKNDKDWEDDYHFFVLQVYSDSISNDVYTMTDAKNSGDKQVSWEKVLSVAPELSELRDVFVYHPIDDRKYELMDMANNIIEKSEWDTLTYEEKEFVMDYYLSNNYGDPLPEWLFELLPKDLKSKYIYVCPVIPVWQYEMLKDAHMKDIVSAIKRKVHTLMNDKTGVVEFNRFEIQALPKELLTETLEVDLTLGEVSSIVDGIDVESMLLGDDDTVDGAPMAEWGEDIISAIDSSNHRTILDRVEKLAVKYNVDIDDYLEGDAELAYFISDVLEDNYLVDLIMNTGDEVYASEYKAAGYTAIKRALGELGNVVQLNEDGAKIIMDIYSYLDIVECQEIDLKYKAEALVYGLENNKIKVDIDPDNINFNKVKFNEYLKRALLDL